MDNNKGKILVEDDSIIKIFPRLTGGFGGGGNGTQVLDDANESNTNPLSEIGHAFAAGLASAFGAESFIAPVRNSQDAESTNRFGSKKNENSSKNTNSKQVSSPAQSNALQASDSNRYQESSKIEQLQIVNSEDEDEEKIQSLSPIIKKEISAVQMFEFEETYESK